MEILSVLYLLVFALSGVMISRYVFSGDKLLKRVFFGLVFGLVMLLWLPVLLAFLFGKFNLLAQLLALAIAVGLGLFFWLMTEKKLKTGRLKLNNSKTNLKPFLWTVIPLVAIGWILHINHTIVPASDGSLHVGQCTYGDLCMHLGFITSISVQQNFPPDYSLLPGTPLGYPFLCDSISSTFYTLGSSLRFAAMLPALYAYLIVVLGVYYFFEQWFKKDSVSVLATYMFLIGGGLGFAYLFNNKQILAAEGISRWNELLTGFYKTPTNLPDEGLRWVNAIADMLLPQRATLFGWALLFPCLQLLHRTATEKENRLFIPLGIIAGCMPLVHTHSFLAVALISVLLFAAAVRKQLHRFLASPSRRANADVFGLLLLAAVVAVVGKVVSKSGNPDFGAMFVFIFCLAEAALMLFLALRKNHSDSDAKETVSARRNYLFGTAALIVCALTLGLVKNLEEISNVGVLVCGLLTLVYLAVNIIALCRSEKTAFKDYITKDEEGRNLLFFIIFGVTAVLLALPQVFGFTLKQASNDSFLRWQFNWDNESDSYLWFYIKNMGLIFIFMFPAFFCSDKDKKLFYGGGLLIWFICEFVLFQPNPYDNNKLLFVWFALTCGIVADYLIKLYKKMDMPEEGQKKLPYGKKLANVFLAMVVLTAIFLSGTLTLVREYVSADHIGIDKEEGSARFGLVESGYQVLTADDVKLAEWVKENTAPDTVILTHNNHNNAVAMLTGRNIFVGTPTFLHWHGVDYLPRQTLLKGLYEEPGTNLYDIAAEYGIEYVRIGNWENRNYSVDIGWFDANLECVFTSGTEKLYRIGNG